MTDETSNPIDHHAPSPEPAYAAAGTVQGSNGGIDGLGVEEDGAVENEASAPAKRPEVIAAVAFVGGLVVARMLRRLGS